MITHLFLSGSFVPPLTAARAPPFFPGWVVGTARSPREEKKRRLRSRDPRHVLPTVVILGEAMLQAHVDAARRARVPHGGR